jgi:plastocyanin
VLLLGIAAVVVLSAGCGSGSAADSAATVASGVTRPVATTHVVMKVLEFTPAAIKAKVGQTVIWTNEDGVAHNVTYVSGPQFTSSQRHLNPGAKFSVRVTQTGTIHYFCTIHPWMRGTIVVTP